MDNKTVLSTYRDICEVNKTQLISEINAALTASAFDFSDALDKERFFALLDTLINSANARGYEIFQSQLR